MRELFSLPAQQVPKAVQRLENWCHVATAFEVLREILILNAQQHLRPLA